MRTNTSPIGGKDSSSSSGGFSSWLSSLEWSTVRNMIFAITFLVVGLYQYFKWKSNKAAKDATRKNLIV